MDDLDKILSRPEFLALTAKQKEILLRAVMECRSNEQADIIGAFIKYIPMLEMERRLTAEEKKRIIDCIMTNMNSEERKNAEAVIAAAKSFGLML